MTFNGDFDYKLHLKLWHNNEDSEELRRAEAAPENESSSVKRSGSNLKCSIYAKTYESDSTVGDLTKKAHGMAWMEASMDYQQKYGRCEIEPSPFECKICGSFINVTPNIVHSHIKKVHGLDGLEYLHRIRKQARGKEPEPFPEIEQFVCWICNNSVKYWRTMSDKSTSSPRWNMRRKFNSYNKICNQLRHQWLKCLIVRYGAPRLKINKIMFTMYIGCQKQIIQRGFKRWVEAKIPGSYQPLRHQDKRFAICQPKDF